MADKSGDDEQNSVKEAEMGSNIRKESEVKDILSKLPSDLHQSIFQRLFKGCDYGNLRTVCKSWRSIAPPRRWHSDWTTSVECPWFMSIETETGFCKFYDPSGNFSYHWHDAELSNCVIHLSEQGFLLLSKGPRSLFLYEPFTKTRIDLPDFPRDISLNGICLSCSPTSLDRGIFFGVSEGSPGFFEISGHRPSSREDGWFEAFTGHKPFRPSLCNPVCLGGDFFVLGQDGKLLSIVVHDEIKFSYFISNYTGPICFPSAVSLSYLVSFEGQLLAVFVGNLWKWVKVFKADVWSPIQSKWAWEEVKSLGDKTVFVSQTSSIAVTAQEESMKNKIYFPILSNGGGMVYSLETCTFQTLAGDHLYHQAKQVHAAWIQPRLVPTFP